MKERELLSPSQIAERIEVDVKIVYNVLGSFGIPCVKEERQTKFFESWVCEVVKAEAIRRKIKHDQAQRKRWKKTTAGRLAEAYKASRGCFLSRSQVAELVLIPAVRQMIQNKAAELAKNENSESKTTTTTL